MDEFFNTLLIRHKADLHVYTGLIFHNARKKSKHKLDLKPNRSRAVGSATRQPLPNSVSGISTSEVMMNGDDILDVDAASALLHADSATVLGYARRGELPGTRIGKSWVFLREDLVAFLKRQISKDTEARRNKPSAPASAVLAPVSPNKRRKALPALPPLPSPPQNS